MLMTRADRTIERIHEADSRVSRRNTFLGNRFSTSQSRMSRVANALNGPDLFIKNWASRLDTKIYFLKMVFKKVVVSYLWCTWSSARKGALQMGQLLAWNLSESAHAKHRQRCLNGSKYGHWSLTLSFSCLQLQYWFVCNAWNSKRDGRKYQYSVPLFCWFLLK